MTSPNPGTESENERVRLAYLVSHPIQYQAPLLRRIAREPEIDLTVFFGSDFSVKGYKDEGFGGVGVKWDVPLLEGYRHEFLPVDPGQCNGEPDDSDELWHFEPSARADRGRRAFDVLWVHGYASVNALHGILAAKALGSRCCFEPSRGWAIASERGEAGRQASLLPHACTDGRWRHAHRHLELRVLALLPGRGLPLFLMPYAVDNDYFQHRSQEAEPRAKSCAAS